MSLETAAQVIAITR